MCARKNYSFCQGFWFDIIPAPHVPGSNKIEQLMHRIKHPVFGWSNNLPPWQFDTGLSVGHNIFMKEQPVFVKRLTRLLKLWAATLHVPGMARFKKGLSFRMELIALSVAKEAKNDMRMGLELALISIRDFKSMQVIFTRFYVPRTPPSKPFLLDPANPRNNLLDQKDGEGVKASMKLATFAKKTLVRLQNEDFNRTSVWDLFLPQMTSSKFHFSKNVIKEALSSQNIHIHSCVTSSKPEHMPREEQPYVLHHKFSAGKTADKYLFRWIAQVISLELRASNATSAQTILNDMQLYGRDHKVQSTSDPKVGYGQCQITLILPVSIGSQKFVRVGFNLET